MRQGDVRSFFAPRQQQKAGSCLSKQGQDNAAIAQSPAATAATRAVHAAPPTCSNATYSTDAVLLLSPAMDEDAFRSSHAAGKMASALRGSRPPAKTQPRRFTSGAPSWPLLDKLEGCLSRQEARAQAVSEQFAWLSPDNVRDARGRRPTDGGYDARTALIPDSVRRKLSGAKAQYWEIKSRYMDVIVFFKCGKFYELYEEDAEIGARVLGWKMTLSGVGGCRQVGVSEVGVEAAVETLVSRGYKVGMIEQMETAQEAKAARGASAVIRRELVSIASAATHGALVPAHPKAAAGAQAVGEEAADAPRGVADVRGGLLCVHERTPVGANAAVQASSFGLAFLDADRGRVVLGLASDEGMSRANLSAVLTRLRPREVLLMAGATHATRRLLAAPPVPLQVSWLGDETPSMSDVARMLPSLAASVLGPTALPAPVLSADEGAQAALCGLLAHVQRMRSACELKGAFSCVAIEPAAAGGGPQDASAQAGPAASPTPGAGAPPSLGPRLAMDGAALEALTIEGPGGLLSRVDVCVTAGGSATVRSWILSPLTDPWAIDRRLDCVETILALPDAGSSLRNALRPCHDLVRSMGILRRCVAEPLAALPVDVQSRAQSRRLRCLRSIADTLAAAVDALEAAARDMGLTMGPGDALPAVLESVFAVGDELRGMGAMEALGCVTSALRAGGGGRGARESVELSEERVRTWAAEEGEDLASDEGRMEVEVRLTTSLVESLLAWSSHWERLERAVSTLDALGSLAAWAQSCQANGPVCRPRVLPRTAGREGAGPPSLALGQFWTPLCSCALTGRAPGASWGIVANDIRLGGEGRDTEPVVIVTGPNMGGKSTAMRGVALCCILAQAGSLVPAASCELTAVSRVFVRMGAGDRLVAGSSTFHEECLDAAAVLNAADQDALVILDELGRGTSTHDGAAIAHAVLSHLAGPRDGSGSGSGSGSRPTAHVVPRVVFSTHFHALARAFEGHPRVSLRHMACQVVAGGDAEEATLVLLYKMVPGLCPKSHGYEVARLAGLPVTLVERARAVGEALEGGWLTGEEVERGAKRRRLEGASGGDELAAAVRQAVTAVEMGAGESFREAQRAARAALASTDV